MSRRRALMGASGGRGHGLPPEYQEVEFIQFPPSRAAENSVYFYGMRNAIGKIVSEVFAYGSDKEAWGANGGLLLQAGPVPDRDELVWLANGEVESIYDPSNVSYDNGVLTVENIVDGTYWSSFRIGGFGSYVGWAGTITQRKILEYNRNGILISEAYPCVRLLDNYPTFFDIVNGIELVTQYKNQSILIIGPAI